MMDLSTQADDLFMPANLQLRFVSPISCLIHGIIGMKLGCKIDLVALTTVLSMPSSIANPNVTCL